ncbi:MAG TPA: hypothetical protein VHD38_01390, partial [Candidatus Paceibacterota bacterium]|nr:hypothetical protein [Candidatus Paceibacterota bacterium]
LNTGYLVYKECTLRGIVDRLRENETASLQQSILLAYQRGRAGLPLFSQSFPLEQQGVYDNAVVKSVQSGYLNTINPAYRSSVQRAIVQGYMAARNQANQAFACPTSSDFWSQLGNLSFDPGCNSYGAYTVANNAVMSAAQNIWNNKLTQLQWGNGTYPVTTIDPATGLEVVVTPSNIVSSNALQAIQTGFSQLQNANDIDQMVGALFAGLTTQVLSDQSGLSGLTQKNGSQPSYLERVVSESAAGVRNSVANAALQILSATQQIEQGFLSAWNGIAQKLVDTIANLRAKENACWNLIISKVCATAPDASGKCTAVSESCTTDPTTGTQTCPTAQILKVATSTTASQTVISTRIAPLATSTQSNIDTSKQAIALIAQLIANVSNTADISAQRLALQQLDNLVAQHALHNQYDLQNALKTKDDVSAQMDTLISDTAQQWGDSTDVNVGWCNINNPSVITYWKNKWKQ